MYVYKFIGDYNGRIKKVFDEFHIQDQKHAINQQLIDIIKFRQNKKWYISISVVALFSNVIGSYDLVYE